MGSISALSRGNVQTINTPSLYSTCPGLSIDGTGKRFGKDMGTNCTWMMHKASQYKTRSPLFPCPSVPGSVNYLGPVVQN